MTTTAVRFEVGPVYFSRDLCRRVPHSPNIVLRMAKYRRIGWTAAWRNQTALLALKYRNAEIHPFNQAAVTITLYAFQPMDRVNAVMSVKAIEDGLKGVLIVDDDATHCALTVRQEKAAKRELERVVVEVREAVF